MAAVRKDFRACLIVTRGLFSSCLCVSPLIVLFVKPPTVIFAAAIQKKPRKGEGKLVTLRGTICSTPERDDKVPLDRCWHRGGGGVGALPANGR